ncbi:MAG: hypothetical protein HRT61_24520, partial [Ekhidna sp.]|nr:hypothetical protein [Ekhidna sp.]
MSGQGTLSDSRSKEPPPRSSVPGSRTRYTTDRRLDEQAAVGYSGGGPVPHALSETETGRTAKRKWKSSSTTAGPTEMSWKNWAKDWCTCIVTVLIVIISWKVFVLDWCLRKAKTARTKK